MHNDEDVSDAKLILSICILDTFHCLEYQNITAGLQGCIPGSKFRIFYYR